MRSCPNCRVDDRGPHCRYSPSLPCPVEKMTPEKAVAYAQDAEFASKLLHGILHKDRDGFNAITFLSKETSPTEQEGREALARLLRGETALLPHGMLSGLAGLIDPDINSPRRLVFEPLNQQFATALRNYQIACWILYLMQGDTDGYAPREGWIEPGKEWDETLRRSYEEAVAEAAEKFGISDRHAKRIYSQAFLKRHRPERKKRRTKHKPKLRVVK